MVYDFNHNEHKEAPYIGRDKKLFYFSRKFLATKIYFTFLTHNFPKTYLHVFAKHDKKLIRKQQRRWSKKNICKLSFETNIEILAKLFFLFAKIKEIEYYSNSNWSSKILFPFSFFFLLLLLLRVFTFYINYMQINTLI